MFADKAKGAPRATSEKEQQQARHAAKDYLAPSDFLLLHALSPQTGKGEEQYGKELRPKDTGKQPGGALETEQDSIDYADIDDPTPE